MLEAQTKLPILRRKTVQERRRFRRIALDMPARCMWSDSTEFEARMVDLCGGGVSLKTDASFNVGDKIIIYIDEIGRLSGEVNRPTEDGFAARIKLVPQKLDRVVDQLTWVANYKRLGLSDERKSNRRAVSGKLKATYEDGTVSECSIIDISLLGVALHTHGQRPEIGSRVVVGSKLGRCARYVDHGFAIEFIKN
jgi:hypothetical protein